MTVKRRNLLIGLAGVLVLSIVGVLISAYLLARRVEPLIREQAILYLTQRFDSEVELTTIRVGMSNASPLRLLFRLGSGSFALVEGEGLLMRHRGRRDIPPMFAVKRFEFQIDLGSLFTTLKVVPRVTVDRMEINIPRKDDRPDLVPKADSPAPTGRLGEVLITNSVLNILPKDKNKPPLHFDLHRIRLEAMGEGEAMSYSGELRNAKPPGEISTKGTVGPWVAESPEDTALSGDYDFANADLGVFRGISGILHSTGHFEGTLSQITAKGEATVPNFRLSVSDNSVPLSTTFEVLIDGTNGDTVLKPVNGKLGSTVFTTSGFVIRNEADAHRTISLDVTMPDGSLTDVLRLAMKGAPFMEGRLSLQTKIDIPPLDGKVREKLLLDGRFEITKGKFLKSRIQNQIDSLSRRGQGQPSNQEIDEVLSGMAGSFRLADEVITFRALSFAVAGAGVDLTGSYDLDKDVMDFHGALKLQAKVSQTMTGWKRWAMKPLDPFFSKGGAGTLLKIQVVGTSKSPQFGRERGTK